MGGVLAVLLGISATGLAVNAGWLHGRWDASHAATALAAKLQKLDGVTSATATYNPLGLPEPTMVAHVSFSVEASPTAWSAATALVRSAASTRALAATTSTADFRQTGSKTHVTVEPMLFTPAEVKAEIAAWRELRRAVGDRVSLHLGYPSGSTPSTGQLVREYTVHTAADERAVAERWPETAPALDPAIATSWNGPGLQYQGMPSRAMMRAVSAVGAVLPLASGVPGTAQTGTFAVILGSVDRYKVTILSLRNGSPTHAEPSEKVARAAQIGLSAGANVVEWVSADGIRSLVSGDCPSYAAGVKTIQTTYHSGRRDSAFAAELARLGFEQPPEVRAGTCR